MFSFEEEIIKALGEELVSLVKYKYCVFGNNAVAVEGHKGLRHLSSQKIVFSLGKKENIVVLGLRLKIKQMTGNYCLIWGQIDKVEVERL